MMSRACQIAIPLAFFVALSMIAFLFMIESRKRMDGSKISKLLSVILCVMGALFFGFGLFSIKPLMPKFLINGEQLFGAVIIALTVLLSTTSHIIISGVKKRRGSKMNMDDRFFIGFGGILEIMGEKNRRRE